MRDSPSRRPWAGDLTAGVWEEDGLLPTWPWRRKDHLISVYFIHSLSWCELSVTHAIPGGFHLGTLPPAGVGESAGLDEGAEEDEAGRLGATFATGELLTGVFVAAVRQFESLKKIQQSQNCWSRTKYLLQVISIWTVLTTASSFWEQELLWPAHFSPLPSFLSCWHSSRCILHLRSLLVHWNRHRCLILEREPFAILLTTEWNQQKNKCEKTTWCQFGFIVFILILKSLPRLLSSCSCSFSLFWKAFRFCWDFLQTFKKKKKKNTKSNSVSCRNTKNS